MLDEPTAGIDPKTRRAIWQLLLAIRQHGVAILLTSHSMEECEAQHLKNKYGDSFLLSFTLANPSSAAHRKIDSLVVQEFEATPTQDSAIMSVLHWEIPRQNGWTWSKLFRQSQAICDRFPVNTQEQNQKLQIKDFSVTQNSLEQVFHRLSMLNDA
uniref:ATPase AAA-type core domain-containing protein n=1 Tax=Ditylenchus dipsaci TaxID=166011 RepID=A0A915E067_9BILA